MAESASRPFHYIDTPEDLADWCKLLKESHEIAVDTEADSMYHYEEQVCLIQMTARGEDALIDPLAIPDLSPLRPAMEDETKVKIFHDAGYDLVGLKRDFEFEVRGIFDTMLAARMLGETRFGLGSLLEKYFGVEADKKWQRSNWAQRPLLDEQIRYAREDTVYLHELADLLTGQLRAKGRMDWLLEDCQRYPERVAGWANSSRVDPEGWWLVKGIRNLDPEEKGRAKALFTLRDKIARKLDRPPFKVFSDSTLVGLAKNPPEDLEELPKKHRIRGRMQRDFGPGILKAVATAKEVKRKNPPPHLRKRKAGRFLDEAGRKRLKALKDARKNAAKRHGVEPEVLAANIVLEEIAEQKLKEEDALRAVSPLDGWRGDVLVEDLLKVMSRA